MAWQLFNCFFHMRGRKNIRLKNYDYHSDGWYFITVVTKQRRKFFIEPKEVLRCEAFFREVIQVVPGVEIETMVIMPDHIHLIIFLESCPIGLGEIIRRMKARVSRDYGQSLWQANYYEHIIRNERSLGEIQEYIILNPDKEPRFNDEGSR